MTDVGEMPDPSRTPAPQVAALVERARRRDPAAFRDLFQAHVGAVHRVVRRMVGGRSDVDDLVQTAFVEAFRSLPDFRGDALFSTWLTRITVRVTMRAGRRAHPGRGDAPRGAPRQPGGIDRGCRRAGLGFARPGARGRRPRGADARRVAT